LKKSLKQSHNLGFLLTLAGVFLFWLTYRLIFRFPEWFDEIFVKAFVFGVPAWVYAYQTSKRKKSSDPMGFTTIGIWQGLFFGLCIGGFFQFVAVLSLRLRGDVVMPSFTAIAPYFWTFLALALMTAWWESLFFFGYVIGNLRDRKMSEVPVVAITTLVFLLFHAPLRFVLVGSAEQLVSQLFVLSFFAIGQAILYLRTKSMYAITLSHMLWGMVFLLYGV